MKAAVFEGEKEKITVKDDYPDPVINQELDQVIIDIVACGVCHTDLGYSDHGVPTVKKPPLILGHEISGKIKEVYFKQFVVN